MRHNRSPIWFAGLTGLIGFLGAASATYAQAPAPAPAQPSAQAPAAAPAPAPAQERRFLSIDPGTAAAPAPAPLKPIACTGPISRVVDVADETLRTTAALFGSNPGGGEGGQFDRTPVLSATVTLVQGVCLNAHLSAIVGGRQTYGVSPLTLFQVSLSRPGFGPRHMVGHYHTPFGNPSPAVALEAERDVDMFAANFFQRVGTGAHEVPPGTYRVDVFWAGAPIPGTGPITALGMAFVLKLYLR